MENECKMAAGKPNHFNKRRHICMLERKALELPEPEQLLLKTIKQYKNYLQTEQSYQNPFNSYPGSQQSPPEDSPPGIKSSFDSSDD